MKIHRQLYSHLMLYSFEYCIHMLYSCKYYGIPHYMTAPRVPKLTVNLLTWNIWWAPSNASRWQMGFNSACKGL